MEYNLDLIIKSGNAYYGTIKMDTHGRYMSWQHCYGIFSRFKSRDLTPDDLDTLSLHLAFYLASWGMYRGSSFLLQRDYSVHIPVVKEIMNQKYKPLWAINCQSLLCSYNIDLLFELVDKLKKIYRDIRVAANNSISKEAPQSDVSDVLITKVLMGTLGCVPAYDRYFCSAVKLCKVSSGLFTKSSLQKLCDYYVNHSEVFEHLRKTMSYNSIEYPQMKVIDMCFWQIGYDAEAETV